MFLFQHRSRHPLLLLVFSLLASVAGVAQSAWPGWLLDGRQQVVRNNYGECWRVGSFDADTDRSACEGSKARLPVAPLAPPPPAQPTVPAEPAPKPLASTITLPPRVQFAFDSAVLDSEASARLDTVLDIIKRRGDQPQVHLVGHTCAMGSDAYNFGLSQRRAASVAAYLRQHGVAAARISTEGKGESQPIASNATEQGRIANRRVEISLQAASER